MDGKALSFLIREDLCSDSGRRDRVITATKWQPTLTAAPQQDLLSTLHLRCQLIQTTALVGPTLSAASVNS